MLNCNWAKALTRYDCFQAKGLDGMPCLEIGTPFSLPDGSAINLYISQLDSGHMQISDNADTLFQLGGMGLDVWNAARSKHIRDMLKKHNVQLSDKGNISLLTNPDQTAFSFAKTVTALLGVSQWASEAMNHVADEIDIVAQLEPYVIARNPRAETKHNQAVKGASGTLYTFDILHGNDLVDIIRPNPQATGAVMRKAGDVLNGPFRERWEPLIIVSDLDDKIKAENEISIIGSMTRAMPASRLMQPQRLH